MDLELSPKNRDNVISHSADIEDRRCYRERLSDLVFRGEVSE